MPDTYRLESLESFQALPLPLRRAVKLHVIHGVPPVEAMHSVGRGRNARRDWQQKAVQQVLAEYAADRDDTDYVALVADIKSHPQTAAEPIQPEIAPGQKSGTLAPSADTRTPISQPGEQAQNSALQTKVLTDCQKQPLFGSTDSTPPRKPFLTTRSCQRCRERIAWHDGIICGPCAAAPEGDPADPEPPAAAADPNMFDLSDLFPHAKTEISKGITSADLWREQDREEFEEREALISELAAQQRRAAEQTAYNLQRFDSFEEPSIRPVHG